MINKDIALQKCSEANKLLIEASISDNNVNLLLLAMDLYNEAISYNSECIPAYLGISVICFSIKNYENTIRVLNTLLAIDPTNSKAKNFLKEVKYKFQQEFDNKQLSEKEFLFNINILMNDT